MRLEPMKFVLNSSGEKNSKQIVKLIYDRYDKEKEPYNETVKVHIQGGYSTAKMISINVIAESYPELLFLNVNKEKQKIWDFGSTFYGKSKIMTGFLFNNGSEPINFSIIHAPNNENNNSQLEIENEIYLQNKKIEKTNKNENEIENCFSFSPSDGIIKPFSKTKIIIRYSPIQEKQIYGFEKQFIENIKNSKIFRENFLIEVPATNQRTFLTVQGTANIPLVTVSPSVVRFGTCAIHDRRDLQVCGVCVWCDVVYVCVWCGNSNCPSIFFPFVLPPIISCLIPSSFNSIIILSICSYVIHFLFCRFFLLF